MPERRFLNVVNENDKVADLRHAFAADVDSSQVKTADGTAHALGELTAPADGSDHPLRQSVIDAISTVYDPEIPVNVYDLGLIYAITITDDCTVNIRMTLTAPGCPVAGDIIANVKRVIEQIPAIKSAAVDLVFDPPWTKERMTEAALLELGLI